MAAPVNAPTNVVDVTLVKPATVVTVAPSVSAVLPKVTAALANLACANVPLEMFDALIAVTLAADPLSAPMKFAADTLPVTAKLLSVPTEVILGCAAVVTVPAVVAEVALATVPVTLPPGIDVSPAPDPLNCDPVIWPVALTNPPVIKLPDVVLPVTAKLLSVPTLVILGCAFVVTVAAVVAVGTVPVTLPPGIDVSPAPEPKYVAAVMLPVALNAPA